MLDQALLPLANDAVRLRPMTADDAAAYADGTRDAAVRAYAHLPAPDYSRQSVVEMIEGVISEGLADGTLAVLTIADAETDSFVGSLVLFDVSGDAAEVGFWLRPEARGRGLTGATLALAAQFALESGLRVLTARTVVDNLASQRVLEGADFAAVCRDPGTAPSGIEVELIHYERTLAPRPDTGNRSRLSAERGMPDSA